MEYPISRPKNDTLFLKGTKYWGGGGFTNSWLDETQEMEGGGVIQMCTECNMGG